MRPPRRPGQHGVWAGAVKLDQLDYAPRRADPAGLSPILARIARSSAVHVAFAFLAMGGWAVFANRQHGAERALLAGLVQGTLSGLLTLGLKRFLEAAIARLPDLWATVLPPTATCAGVLAILLSAHHLAGTPNVWATISVPYAVSSSYAWIYSIGLVMARRREAAA
jgi:hypothetical protein